MGNFAGNIPGFISPPLTGWILDQGGCPRATAKVCNGTSDEGYEVGYDGLGNTTAAPMISEACERAWDTVFIIAVAVSALGILTYAITGHMHPVYRQAGKSKTSVQ